MKPVFDFNGQVALVTGASAGIGLATATAFAEAGAAVVRVDINERPLRAATEELTSSGRRVVGITSDVADEAQAAAVVAQAVAAFGRVDMAFNNAGIAGPSGDLLDETAEAFDKVHAVNPGVIDTPMFTDLLETSPDAMKEVVRDQPIGRLGRSDEIAASVLWLCSPGAGFVIGAALPVDGGFTAH